MYSGILTDDVKSALNSYKETFGEAIPLFQLSDELTEEELIAMITVAVNNKKPIDFMWPETKLT